jgi:hypothetical protein
MRAKRQTRLKQLTLSSGLILIALLLIRLAGPAAADVSYALQATDILRRTPTIATVTPTATPAATLGWRGQIVSNTPYATSGNGSIVRVHVFERTDEPITLTRYDTTLSGLSGTKPEYGPYAAEFAPVPPGRWIVSLPDLDTSVEIETDGYNLVVVEFAPYTAAEATAAAGTTPTPTPIGGEPWEGQVISVSEGPLLDGALLRVTVQGQSGHAVKVSTLAGFVTQSTTGTKEELGPNTAEFAPLTDGRYIITPAGLNTSLTLDLNRHTTVVVEFRPISGWPQPTPTSTPVPGTPTPTPSPTPTSSMQWVGAVVRHDRPYQGKVFAAIAVRVNGLQHLPVMLTSGDTTLTCTTGSKSEYGDYACEFGGLSPGTYTIGAYGLDPVIPVVTGQGDFVLIEFRQEPMPSGPTVWLSRLVRNTSQPWPGNGVSSAIAVRVEGRRGQVVSLRSAGGWEAFCETGTKPEYGDYACEFGGLWPGVYTVSPASIPAQISLYMDGIGFAEVAFESSVATATPAATPTRVIGAGASPVASRETTPAPTPTRTPTEIACAGTPTPASTRPRPVATATPTLTPTLTPTTARGWVGRVVQDDAGVGIGTIVVRVLGLKDQPVILRSGAWSIRGLTGTKPEYGEHAVEFGGLNRGDFTLELEGLGATLPVHLQPGGFLLVEFRYDLLPPPTPTPQHGIWVGTITRNTSGNTPAGAWSTIIVKVPGVDGLPVTLDSGGGFVTTCVTGTKPEHGPGACEVGGLWPATYRVTPQGLGPSVDVWLDGLGSATVEFWVQ